MPTRQSKLVCSLVGLDEASKFYWTLTYYSGPYTPIAGFKEGPGSVTIVVDQGFRFFVLYLWAPRALLGGSSGLFTLLWGLVIPES